MSIMTRYLVLCCSCLSAGAFASDAYFNADLLHGAATAGIDVRAFDRAGYLTPGTYVLTVHINGRPLGARHVQMIDPGTGDAALCLRADLARELGLRAEALASLLAAPDERGCYPTAHLAIRIQPNLATDTLAIAIPQAYLDRRAQDWDPPERWETGVAGGLLDMALNVQEGWGGRARTRSASAYGVAGVNAGLWRGRAHWQASARWRDDAQQGREASEEARVSAVYAYRPLPVQGARLALGELSLGASLFDPFNFTGASLISDDAMLPPGARGYAPDVVGIAERPAKVIISQQGQVLYETQVAQGPFRIQSLDSALVGRLDVRVELQDGQVQTFSVNVPNVPTLARPGTVRYRLHAGQAGSAVRAHDGPGVGVAEASWGVSNGFSLLGGGLLAHGYRAASLGVGRDLLAWGGISATLTGAQAAAGPAEGAWGQAYQLQYAKRLDAVDGELTLATTRVADRHFMTLPDYMAVRQPDAAPWDEGRRKVSHSLVMSKQLAAPTLSAYLDYTQTASWQGRRAERLSMQVATGWDALAWQGVGATLTGYVGQQGAVRERGLSLSLSFSLGPRQRLSYSTAVAGREANHRLTYSMRSSERDYYALSAASTDHASEASAFVSHVGDLAALSASASHQSGGPQAVGVAVQTGLTATAEGAAWHRTASMGGARLLVDTDGAAQVPMLGGALPVRTNDAGKAVITDVASYQRLRTHVDVSQLTDDTEPLGSPVQRGTLTEGAIGYRHFPFLTGSKRLLALVMEDGQPAPFAAQIHDARSRPLGMVASEGMAYLAGLVPGATLTVTQGAQLLCQFTLPIPLPAPDEIVTLQCQPPLTG